MLEAARRGNDPEAPTVEQLRLRQVNMLRYVVEHPLEQYFVQRYSEYLERNGMACQSPYVENVKRDSRMILELGRERGEVEDFPLEFLVTYTRQKATLLNAYVLAHPELLEQPELLDRMLDKLMAVIVKAPSS